MFDMKKQLKWSKLKVGLVITLALLILITAVFFAGKMEKIFLPKIELKVQFQDVRGLRKGAPVWIFGTEVGTVKGIHLDPVLGAIVKITVNKNIQGFIKKDAQANILTMGLLGDKYIELSTGSPQSGPISRGEMIKGMIPVEFSDMMETAAVSIGRMGEFIKKLDSLLEKMEKGEGTVAKFFKDPSVYNNLNNTIQNLSLMLGDIKDSKGTIRMLIEDPSLYQKILTTVSSIEDFSKTLKESSGTLKRFIDDPSLYNKTFEAVSSIEAFSRKLNEGTGALKRFVDDPSLYDKTLAAISSIEQFSKKLNEEKGTLKRLVEDPQLYENLNQGLIELSSILKGIEQGEGLAGVLLKDKELVRELKETIVELKELMKDIKDHPKKYFKFSIF